MLTASQTCNPPSLSPRECFHAGVPATGEVICEEIATCIWDSGEFARLGCERETRLYQDFRDQTVKLPITLSDTTHSARTKTFLQAKYASGNTLAKVLLEPHLSFRLLEKESLFRWPPPITVVGDICKHCTNSSRGTYRLEGHGVRGVRWHWQSSNWALYRDRVSDE